MKLLCIILLATSALAGVPWIPEPQTQQDWMPWNWMERHWANTNYTAVNGDRINVLFYGDSITEGWDYTGRLDWDQYYTPLGAANYGIGGDRTEHVLWRIMNGEVEGISPKLIVLKIGTNNVGANTEGNIAQGIAAIVNELRGRLPSTKILLLGVLPRNNAELSDFVETINGFASILDNGDTVRYHSMKDDFYKGNGEFYTEYYTSDLLHLSGPGYTRWRMSMTQLFDEMWNSAK